MAAHVIDITHRLTSGRLHANQLECAVRVGGGLVDTEKAAVGEFDARLRQSGEPVGLATVYRTLSLLSEHGVVDEFANRPGETCYRLCGEGHHHHLVCARCHGVAELEGCEVDEWLSKAAREHGFAPTAHTLEVTGLCADCQAA